MTRLIFVLVAFLNVAQTLSAQITAEKLLDQCTATSDASKIGCAAYIDGFMDAIGLQSAYSKQEYICFPEEPVSATQGIRIVVKWLQDHPQDLHTSGRLQVLLALRAAFPCGK